MATGLSSVSSEWVQHNAAEFKAAFYRLLDEETFVASITYGPNHVRSVKCRFERTKTMLSEVDPFHFLCLDLEEEDEE
jgi:hypothetical protein